MVHRRGTVSYTHLDVYKRQPIHKAIICGFYLQGQKWERIAEQISYSVRQSKNIRCVALEVLGCLLYTSGRDSVLQDDE